MKNRTLLLILILTVALCKISSGASVSEQNTLLISGDDITTVGQMMLEENIIIEGDDELVITPFSTPSDITTTAGALDISAAPVADVNGKNRASVTLTVSVDGKAIKRMIVNYRISIIGDVLVASRNISRHDTISKSDVKVERKDILKSRSTAIRSLDQIEGLRATRYTRAGSVMTEGLVEPVPLVRKGQEIIITVKSAGVVVTSPGYAMEDGGKYDLITVRSNFSKEDFTAKVVDEARVSIDLNPSKENN